MNLGFCHFIFLLLLHRPSPLPQTMLTFWVPVLARHPLAAGPPTENPPFALRRSLQSLPSTNEGSHAGL
jgi:hypothetical protein